MLCDKCKQRQATVHVVKFVNDNKYEQNLCEQCSKEFQNVAWGSDPNFSLNKFLANLLNYDPAFSEMHLGTQSERCDNCGMTYQQFSQSGKLGCSNCYTKFQDKLDPLIRRIHSAEVHKGKVPERTGGRLKLEKEISNLRTELSQLVMREEFEKAAEVRDKIIDLEKRMAG